MIVVKLAVVHSPDIIPGSVHVFSLPSREKRNGCSMFFILFLFLSNYMVAECFIIIIILFLSNYKSLAWQFKQVLKFSNPLEFLVAIFRYCQKRCLIKKD